MDNMENFYSFSEAPNWVPYITEKDLIELTKKNEKNNEIIILGKGLCYIRREIISTSELSNQNYTLCAWDLNNSEILQAASVSEVILTELGHLKLHQIKVVRDGEILDKKEDLKVRVLDDELGSSYGSINKNKKVHFIVNNLQLGDILIWEQTIVTTFTEKNFVDRKYFRTIHELPRGYWFYNQYDFMLIQNRDEVMSVKQRYFRDEKGQLLPDKITKLSLGDTYSFNEKDYILESKPDEFSPYFEIATESSWKDISLYIFTKCKEVLTNSQLKDFDLFKLLNLDNDELLERKITRIIEYVQNQIVYIFDADVMHGYLPQSFDKTFNLKSGDCKAKSLLLINLLDSIGVKSEFILVNYEFDPYIPLSLPSPFVFNHAIVKINFENKFYFIDPTWKSQSGLLKYRSEPFFSSYLPILGDVDLQTKEELSPKEIRLEEEINISVKKGVNTITIKSIYRKELADSFRNDFKKLNIANMLQLKMQQTAECLGYSIEGDLKMYFSNEIINIISDDHDENMIVTIFEATLLKPYIVNSAERVVKYYNSINFSELYNFNHKDAFCMGFFMFPQKTTLIIESDFFIKKSESTTKKDFIIDNEYLFFSNKKEIYLKKIRVVSEYLPKKFSPIKREDIRMMIESYKNINMSNFGVGVVYLDKIQFITQQWYFAIIVFIIFELILFLF